MCFSIFSSINPVITQKTFQNPNDPKEQPKFSEYLIKQEKIEKINKEIQAKYIATITIAIIAVVIGIALLILYIPGVVQKSEFDK